MGRGRAAYAYRDLDEQVFFPPVEHDYHSQESPLPFPEKASLSESAILRSHFDKTRARRRRLLLAAGGLLLLCSFVLMVMVTKMEPPRSQSALELAISAPYGALRGRGDVKPSRSTPYESELGTLHRPGADDPNVGDPDPNDAHDVNASRTEQQGAPSPEIEESEESDLYYYEDGFIQETKKAQRAV